MDDLYRDEILEHYREPHNFGTLDAPDASYEGQNPLCGDRITMMLIVDGDGAVSDVAFSGRGCAISQASASLLTDEIKGRPVAEVEAMSNQDILDLLGIRDQPRPPQVRAALARNAAARAPRARRQGGHDRGPGGQRMTPKSLGVMVRGSSDRRPPATDAGV